MNRVEVRTLKMAYGGTVHWSLACLLFGSLFENNILIWLVSKHFRNEFFSFFQRQHTSHSSLFYLFFVWRSFVYNLAYS